MREFERSEVMHEKCHFCGCKNKLSTDLKRDDGIIVGYTLRCCNCGKINTFIKPSLQSETIRYIDGYLHSGKQKCIQESGCIHKQCSLYGTCPDYKNDDIKIVPKNRIPIQDELTVKAINKPRFL